MTCSTLPFLTGGYIEPMALTMCDRSPLPIVLLSAFTIVVVIIMAGLWAYVTTPVTYIAPVETHPYFMKIVPWTPIPVPKPRPKQKILPMVPIRRTDVEIKGLAERFAAAKRQISAARDATGKFDETVGAFVSSLNDVTDQVSKMHDDLKFESETLGNSPPAASAPVGSQPAETAHLPSVKGA